MTSRQYKVLAILLGALSAFAPMSIDMYLPSFPTLRQEFSGHDSMVQATLSMFFVGLAVGQAFYGPVSDRFGRKRPLYFGIGLYIVGSLMAALTPSLEGLVAARFLQGIGGCAGMVIARAIVRDLFDERESAKMLTALMLVMGLAPILAPSVGGQLLTLFGWQSIFWVLTGFGVFCLALSAAVLQESLPAERRTTGGVVTALRSYWLLATDLRFLGFVLTGACVMSGMFAYVAGSPFVFIELNGVKPELFGILFGLNAFGLIAASQLNHRLLKRYSSRTILRAAIVGFATAAILVGVATLTGIGGFPGFLACLFFVVSSYGLVSPNTTAAAMAMHGRIAGAASAFLGITQFTVGAIAASLVGLLADGSARPMAFIIGGCGVLALVMQYVCLRERH